MPFADPSAQKRKVWIISDKDEFKRLQGPGLWDEKQEKHLGSAGNVELTYPNGDVAVSFEDGEWLRMSGATVAGRDEKGTSLTVRLPCNTEEVPLDLVLQGGLVVVAATPEPISDITKGTIITHIDGTRVHTVEEAVEELRTGAAVRGYCTLTLSPLKAAHVNPTSVPAPAATPDPAQPVSVVTTSMIGSGKTYPSARDALKDARERLVDLLQSVSQQKQELEEIERLAREEDANEKKRRAADNPVQPIGEVVIAKEITSPEGVMEVFEKLHHGKRRDDVDKQLACLGNPELEDMEFWDLRNSSEELKPSMGQVALEVFYFGEMEEAGVPNTFKVNLIEKLASVGVNGAIAPADLKEAGCMYPLIGVPILLPWEDAVRFGNIVFENFGIPREETDGNGDHSSKEPAGGGGGGGCAQQ
eukprot:TRINITY_DN3705_c0_g1_i1.p1 TRINITY_DN3705_c0_g1~~TRINITY_DN3705_c0_g1_i1.p1  ORF type:complete len:417 (+),score=123.83 TRINITY_DN3705_c0_g1_i1:715-1965(+)